MDITIGTVIDAYPLDELLYRGGAKSGGSNDDSSWKIPSLRNARD